MEILVMNRRDAISYSHQKHPEKSIVISINNVEDLPAGIIKNTENGIHDVLRLFFDDVDDGAAAMSENDALKIATFVCRYTNTDIDRIIVHCGAGQSRSAGVAAAIIKYLYGNDSCIFNDRRYRPNMLCYRKTLFALTSEE